LQRNPPLLEIILDFGLGIRKKGCLMSIINRLISKIYKKGIKRRQFNLTIDEKITDGVKAIALILEVPMYAACEHLLQVGTYHMMDVIEGPEGRERLQGHMVRAHLLGLESDEGDFLAK
jgi:hypothetical protein